MLSVCLIPQSDIAERSLNGSSRVVRQQDGSAVGWQRSRAGPTSDDAPDADPESQSQTRTQTCHRSLVTTGQQTQLQVG